MTTHEIRESVLSAATSEGQARNYLQKEDKSQSVGNLIKLYEQGFHICNSSFGQIRDEDCIFCLNVIDRTEE